MYFDETANLGVCHIHISMYYIHLFIFHTYFTVYPSPYYWRPTCAGIWVLLALRYSWLENNFSLRFRGVAV